MVPHIVLALPRSHLHNSKLVHCAAWSRCRRGLDQTIGDWSCCSKDILDQNAHFLRDDGTSWCRMFCSLLRNDMTWPFRYVKICASQRHAWTRRARQPRSQRIGSCLHPISSNLFCVRESRTRTSGHSHLWLEGPHALGAILWC